MEYIIEQRVKRFWGGFIEEDLNKFAEGDYWFLIHDQSEYVCVDSNRIAALPRKTCLFRIPKTLRLSLFWDSLECRGENNSPVTDLSVSLDVNLSITDSLLFMNSWQRGGESISTSELIAAWQNALRNDFVVELKKLFYASLSTALTLSSMEDKIRTWLTRPYCSRISQASGISFENAATLAFQSPSQIEKQQRDSEEQQKKAEAAHQKEIDEIELDAKLSRIEKDTKINAAKLQMEVDQKAHDLEKLRLEAEEKELKRRIAQAEAEAVRIKDIVEGNEGLPPEASDLYRRAWEQRWPRLSIASQKKKLENFQRFLRSRSMDFDLHLREENLISRSVGDGIACTERVLSHMNPLNFEFAAPLDGWLTILNFGSSGMLTVLLPNCMSNGETLRVYSGKTYNVPADFMEFPIEVNAEEHQYGIEGIGVLITPEPLVTNLNPGNLTSYPPDILTQTLDIMEEVLKNIPSEQWSVGLLEFITRPQREIITL